MMNRDIQTRQTGHSTRSFAILGAAMAVSIVSIVVSGVAAADSAATTVFTLTPSTHGNPEGVAFDRRSGAFFVGATRDGTICRGTLDNPSVEVFIPGAAGKSAIGLKVANDRLYVAGGATGTLVVYDLASRQQIAS